MIHCGCPELMGLAAAKLYSVFSVRQIPSTGMVAQADRCTRNSADQVLGAQQNIALHLRRPDFFGQLRTVQVPISPGYSLPPQPALQGMQRDVGGSVDFLVMPGVQPLGQVLEAHGQATSASLLG